jgi:hypothetical protein
LGLTAPEACQTPGRLALDQGLKRLANDSGILGHPGEFASPGKLLIVECDGRSHPNASAKGTEYIIV